MFVNEVGIIIGMSVCMCLCTLHVVYYETITSLLIMFVNKVGIIIGMSACVYIHVLFTQVRMLCIMKPHNHK